MQFLKKNIVCATVLCFFLPVIIRGFDLRAQQKTVDSLNLALKTAVHDTTRAHLYLKLGDLLYVAAPDTLEYFAGKAEEIINKRLGAASKTEKRVYLNIQAEILNNRAYMLQQHGKMDEALDMYNRGLEIQKQTNDKEGIAYSYNNIATIYQNRGEETKALEYNELSLKIKLELKDEKGIAQSYNNMGLFISISVKFKSRWNITTRLFP